MVYLHLPNFREQRRPPLDLVGLILFGSGISLLSYVLEVFGETTLSGREMLGLLLMSAALLAGYGMNTRRTRYPLLRLRLLRIRSLRLSVAGNLLTRLGIGGIPFLLPLLYQVGLGFTAIQSGLLIMPQALAAMSLKMAMPLILQKMGYRTVLIGNTLLLGVMIMLFATIGLATPVWLIVLQAFLYGFLTSMQYTSMNTLAYADVSEHETADASTIASTVQQLAVSFGVAAASLTAALFIPDHVHATAAQMLHGIHFALLALAVLTIASTLVFWNLKSSDGAAVSRHKVQIPAA
jgi:MFS family permease